MKKTTKTTILSALLYCALIYTPSYAGEADVLTVNAKCNENNECTFSVRVRHNDKGWKHYVNRWEILSLGGEVLASRTLAHPHVDEQPFTRRLKAVIAPEYKSVIVRAHDSVDGYGGKEIITVLRP